jgi:hypothetical protein
MSYINYNTVVSFGEGMFTKGSFISTHLSFVA